MSGTEVKVWKSLNGPRVGDRLEEWLTSDKPTTMGTLSTAFGRMVFPVGCIVLMAPSALPIPSGGATHILDVIAVLFAGQIVLGRQTLWLPARWRKKELGAKTIKAMGLVVRLIRRCERISRPRGTTLMDSALGRIVFGIISTAFVVGAFVSPPFSGLDTLPSLGVVLVCLGLVLEDVLFSIIGTVVGVIGVGLTIGLGLRASDAILGLIG